MRTKKKETMLKKITKDKGGFKSRPVHHINSLFYAQIVPFFARIEVPVESKTFS
jgi:hypothetical protein